MNSKKLYSDPNNKDAIPYRTSYYKRDWGFCITDNQKNLKKGNYNVFIDSKIDKNGSMTFGEIFIKGKSSKEIFFLHIYVILHWPTMNYLAHVY